MSFALQSRSFRAPLSAIHCHFHGISIQLRPTAFAGASHHVADNCYMVHIHWRHQSHGQAQNASVFCAATAMRRASSRAPKRSLDTDFELSQAVSQRRRRVPGGQPKGAKAAFTSTGAIIPPGAGYALC